MLNAPPVSTTGAESVMKSAPPSAWPFWNVISENETTSLPSMRKMRLLAAAVIVTGPVTVTPSVIAI